MRKRKFDEDNAARNSRNARDREARARRAGQVSAAMLLVDQVEVAAISSTIQAERRIADRLSAADRAASSALLREMSQPEVEAITRNMQTETADRLAAGLLAINEAEVMEITRTREAETTTRLAAGLVQIEEAAVGAIRRTMEANRSPIGAAQPASGEGLPPDMANYKHDPVHMQRLFAASRGEEAVSIF